ncbi:hypothetical protein Zmor_014394 [Zophobas morio]|uniref:Uncharacterized protein n=1 Tax=Zophobas morio TaxID=2755281 RepID=A0AA38IC19_9CUCU|nr:hypothetical protein Zmor_014394 [Zophobas morio]
MQNQLVVYVAAFPAGKKATQPPSQVPMTNVHNRTTCALSGRRSPKMAGVGGAVMIRRCFNDEVVVMETAGTGQGRSAGRAGAAGRRRYYCSGGHHAISSGLAVDTLLARPLPPKL